MYVRTMFSTIAFAFVASAIATPVVAAPVAVKPIEQWSGSVADASLTEDAPEFIVDAKRWKNLWKKWGLEGKPPEVDFDKALVVITTTRGSRLSLMASLGDAGDLRVGGIATRDLRPGFRYVIAALPRDGVKSVNGTPIEKE